MYLRLHFTWKLKASNLKQPKLSASYKRKCTSNFSISECYFLNLKKVRHKLDSLSFVKSGVEWEGRVEVSKLYNNRGGPDFFFKKNSGIGKIGGVV